LTPAIFSAAAGAGAYRRILRLRLLALLPVTVAAILTTGYRYLSQLSADPDVAGDGLRESLARALGADYVHAGIYDWIAAGMAHFLPVLLVALLAGGFWEWLVARYRDQPANGDYLLTALTFTLLLPAAAPFYHVVFGMSFAILVGSAIFGGDGRTFLSPPLLGIVILQVGFPGVGGSHPLWQGLTGYGGSNSIALFYSGGEAALGEAGIDPATAFVGTVAGAMGTTSVLAVGIGAALLLGTRVISWRLLLGQVIGLIFVAGLVDLLGAAPDLPEMPAWWHLLIGGFAFGAVFLVCDPVASSCTNPGRWAQGFLLGALVVLIRTGSASHPDAIIPAALLASILAPLIDYAVIALNIRRRARRHA
jgi:Na+-transporting NADH:ubiquinone oxidoreductase subunit B